MLKQANSSSISANQFMFTVACFVQGSSMVIHFFTPMTSQDSWLSVLLGYLVFLVFIIPWFILMKQFPNKNLFTINEEVFGKILGKAVSVIYLLFIFTLSSLNVKDLGNFVKKTMMNDTPEIAIIFLFLFLCAWGVKKGLDVVTRYAGFFFILSFLILLLTIVLGLSVMDFTNFFPMFTFKPIQYIQSTNLTVDNLGEIIIFLMIVDKVDTKQKNPIKFILLGTIIGWISFFLALLRNIAVLGNLITLFALPTFETFRLISLSNTINRAEVLFSILMVMQLFFKIIFLLYVLVICVTQIFKFPNSSGIAYTVALLVLCYSFIVYSNSTDHAHYSQYVLPPFWVGIKFGIPFITMIVSLIKGKIAKNKVEKVVQT